MRQVSRKASVLVNTYLLNRQFQKKGAKQALPGVAFK